MYIVVATSWVWQNSGLVRQELHGMPFFHISMFSLCSSYNGQVQREACDVLFFRISSFSLCSAHTLGMAELGPSETRGPRRAVLSHFDVLTM
ncbi:hypothetical protein L208DRAFT_1384037 [Tricholoma matsutake]|nr:hypothetical protein L208DRAFT_1384037 [Tricholoma matsutake 945]